MHRLSYHTSIFSSMHWNNNISSAPSTTSTFSSLAPNKNGKISSCPFTSTEENDPMLGYASNINDRTPPSPPTQNQISFDYHFHTSSSTHSNTGSITIPPTPTTSTSAETMLCESSSLIQQKENEITTVTTNLPLSPESLYESPLLPPSSGILSTSDILDDTTGLGLPCSLFILAKEPSFASGLECSFNNNNNNSNDNIYPSVTPTTSTTTSLLSSSDTSTVTSSTPMIFSDQEEDNTVIEDMDYYFSEEEEEEEEEEENNHNEDEEEHDGDEEEEDDDVDDEEDTWPTKLTHGISFNSSIGDSEYGDLDQEHHPLTGLLIDLRKQVDTNQLLKKQEWISLYKHIEEVLNHVGSQEEAAPEIRQCVINCVQQLQSRYQNVFVFPPNEFSLQQQIKRQQVDDYQEEEEIIDVVRDDDRQEPDLMRTQLEIVREQHPQNNQENDESEEEEELRVPSSRSRCHLQNYRQQQDKPITLQKRYIESSDDEEGDSGNDEPWIPEETIEEEEEDDVEEDEGDEEEIITSLSESSVLSSATIVTKPEQTVNTRTIKKRRSGSSSRGRSLSSSSSYRNSKKTRKNYSRETTRILMDWYLRHGGKTPEPKHKEELAKKANKSHVQISTWFQNARRRHHSKLVLYQKLNKEYPDKVYDFDTYERFRSKKSLSINPKKRSISDVNNDDDDDDDDKEEFNDDNNSNQGAGSSISSMNKRVRN